MSHTIFFVKIYLFILSIEILTTFFNYYMNYTFINLKKIKHLIYYNHKTINNN